MTWYANSEGRYGENGKKGDLGEKIVEEYCHKNGIEHVEKNDYNSQVKLKIDCTIDGVDVDVKTNFYKGFLCVELANDNKDKPGWIYTTTAKEIYGVDSKTKSIFRYKVEDMIEYINNNQHRAKRTKYNDLVMWVSVDEKFIERLQ